jgi:uncharacterized protein
MRGYHRLIRYGVIPGAICVLTRDSLRWPDEIYNFFLHNGFRSLAFNVEEVENNNRRSSLTTTDDITDEYRRFISRIYDLWYKDAGSLSIREFTDMFSIISRKRHDPCYQRRPLETQTLAILTIHKNGDISTFSPEFAGGKSTLFDNFVIGNIASIKKVEDIIGGTTLVRIEREVREGIKACSETCLYFDLCGGAYTSNKFFENGSLRSTETTACRLHRQTLSSVIIDKLSV